LKEEGTIIPFYYILRVKYIISYIIKGYVYFMGVSIFQWALLKPNLGECITTKTTVAICKIANNSASPMACVRGGFLSFTLHERFQLPCFLAY
jgi:hypothetical protein